MKSRGLLLVALSLLLIGLVGLAAVSFATPQVDQVAPGHRTFTSLGQQIYFTGVDSAGPIPRSGAGGGMMGTVACVNCHRQDGRGGRLPGMMFGTVDVPDIRYSVLTNPRSDNGTTVPAWTETDIARAIRDGVEPSGQTLKGPMPRWDMSEADLNAVIAYLKELDAR